MMEVNEDKTDSGQVGIVNSIGKLATPKTRVDGPIQSSVMLLYRVFPLLRCNLQSLECLFATDGHFLLHGLCSDCQ